MVKDTHPQSLAIPIDSMEKTYTSRIVSGMKPFKMLNPAGKSTQRWAFDKLWPRMNFIAYHKWDNDFRRENLRTRIFWSAAISNHQSNHVLPNSAYKYFKFEVSYRTSWILVSESGTQWLLSRYKATFQLFPHTHEKENRMGSQRWLIYHGSKLEGNMTSAVKISSTAQDSCTWLSLWGYFKERNKKSHANLHSDF